MQVPRLHTKLIELKYIFQQDPYDVNMHVEPGEYSCIGSNSILKYKELSKIRCCAGYMKNGSKML